MLANWLRRPRFHVGAASMSMNPF